MESSPLTRRYPATQGLADMNISQNIHKQYIKCEYVYIPCLYSHKTILSQNLQFYTEIS